MNKTGTNALADWTDIEAAWKLFQAMTDEAGNYIRVYPNVLLVPTALLATAAHIKNAIKTETGKDTESYRTASANAQLDAMGLGGLQIRASYYLDAVDTTTWYIGDFKRGFYEHVVFPLETREVPGDARRDIVTTFIARRKSRVFARDDKFVVQCPGS